MITTKLLTAKGYPVDTVLQFTCLHGYELVGTNMRYCDGKGQWSNSNPTCVLPATKATPQANPQGCYISQTIDKAIVSIINQTKTVNYIEHGKIMNYTCKENNLHQYTAYCSNGTLIIDQNCSEMQGK